MVIVNFSVDDRVFFKRDFIVDGYNLKKIKIPKDTEAIVTQVINNDYLRIVVFDNIEITLANDILGRILE